MVDIIFNTHLNYYFPIHLLFFGILLALKIFIINYTDRPLFYDLLGIYVFVEDESFIFYFVKIIY